MADPLHPCYAARRGLTTAYHLCIALGSLCAECEADRREQAAQLQLDDPAVDEHGRDRDRRSSRLRGPSGRSEGLRRPGEGLA
jgi:hypothetical protein